MESNELLKCDNCGSMNPSNYVFCIECGARMDGKFMCENCGTLLEKDTVFCTYCGKRYDGKKECPDCSVVLVETANFCWKCGHSFNEDISNKKKTLKPLKQENSSCEDKQKYLFKLIKLSLIAALALTMFILCFLPMQTLSFYNNDIKVNSTTYITLMFDQTKEYENQEEFLDTSLGKKIQSLNEQIAENPYASSKLMKKHSVTYLRGMLILARIEKDNADYSMMVDLSIRGILSFFYIISTAAVFMLSVLKLIFFIFKKDINLNRYNFLYALPILFVVPLALFAIRFYVINTAMHGCLIAYIAIFSVLLVSKAVFHIIENKIQCIRQFVMKVISICLVATSIGCLSLSIFKMEFIHNMPGQQERTYEYSYDSYSMIYAFNGHDLKNREAVTSKYEDLKDYVDHLNSDISYGYHLMPVYYPFDEIPSNILILNGISFLNFIINTNFLSFLLMIVFSTLLLYFLYQNLIDNEKAKSAIKLSILFFTFSLISLLFSIATICLLDLILENIYNLIFKISAGFIVVATLSIVNMIMTKASFKEYNKEKD